MALDFAAGCVGGCAGIMVGYPLDTIKVHIQTQDYRNPKYRGTWHCFRTILAKESIAGFYRGMSSPMAGVAVINAIVFGIYGHTHRNSSNPEALYSHFLAGASAGIAQTPICSPMELAKTRLQLQSSTGTQFVGPLHVLKHIYRTEGFRGIFNGLGITLLREAPSYGIYFFTYEALTRNELSAPTSTLTMLMAGGLAGTASWVVSYPLDVIKSRLQAAPSSRYANALDCYRQSIQAEGYACLFRGLNSTIIRAFPTNAATFAAVTWTFRLFGQNQVEVDAPQPEAKEIIVNQNRGASKDERFLKKWNSLLDNIWSNGQYAKTCSTLSMGVFDNSIVGTSALNYRKERSDNEIKDDKDQLSLTRVKVINEDDENEQANSEEDVDFESEPEVLAIQDIEESRNLDKNR
ncbi:mitochondrial basic amino acids transporter [Cephus cinctus]|uniref:Mitochondrial basic amino acids transporter n=1 Tax=Cephus cinctus TaxID=211228 RepID=A0AAJ7FU59_CEPCN|nr:mitochondrial basic amino acids transporter [Cephus cinctus]